MATRTSSRWLALAGPIAAVLVILAFFVLQNTTPGIDDSTEEIVEHYRSEKGRATAAAFLVATAAAFVVAFVSHLRSLLSAAGAAATAATMLLAGVVIYATGLLVGAGVHLSLVDAADNNNGEAATTLNYLDNGLWMPMVTGTALLLIGAGWSVLDTGVLPRWLGWVALVAGIISLLGPGGFLGFFVLPLWLLVAGVLLFLREGSEVTAPVV